MCDSLYSHNPMVALCIASDAAATGSGNVQGESIKKINELMREAGGLVKIEDVLPLFPDFVQIDNFKDAICQSLEDYNTQIAGLKNEMDDATRIADALRQARLARKGHNEETNVLAEKPFTSIWSRTAVSQPSRPCHLFCRRQHGGATLMTCEYICRKDVAMLEHRRATLDLAEPCARCGRGVGEAPAASAGPSGGAVPKYFLFPTGNTFHGSCLAQEVIALAPPQQQARIKALLTALAKASQNHLGRTFRRTSPLTRS